MAGSGSNCERSASASDKEETGVAWDWICLMPLMYRGKSSVRGKRMGPLSIAMTLDTNEGERRASVKAVLAPLSNCKFS